MEWISGEGRLYYVYDVTEKGSYSVFVENNNNFSIKVTGTAMY